jgi:hypothetical protein
VQLDGRAWACDDANARVARTRNVSLVGTPINASTPAYVWDHDVWFDDASDMTQRCARFSLWPQKGDLEPTLDRYQIHFVKLEPGSLLRRFDTIPFEARIVFASLARLQ